MKLECKNYQRLKIFIYVFLFIIRNTYSQSLSIKKILLNRDFKIENVSKDHFFYSKYLKDLFGRSDVDNILKYSTNGYDIRNLDKSEGYCFVLKYSKENDFQNTIKIIDERVSEGNKYFVNDKNDQEWKDYIQFVDFGLIIAIISSNKSIILLHVKSCLQTKNKIESIKELKKNKTVSQIYSFNCGGEEFAKRIK